MQSLSATPRTSFAPIHDPGRDYHAEWSAAPYDPPFTNGYRMGWEAFIRHVVAYDVAARMRYKGLTLAAACAEVFAELPEEEDGVGGLIALDKDGRVATPFNTNGLFRGTITADGTVNVKIFEK